MLTGRKLLLADDSLTIQKVVSLTFNDEEMKVTTVGSGAEALEHLGGESLPDIVLADVFMPGPNGYELCERIKADERTRHIPVLLLVGTFEPFNEAEARRVGADEVLTKPFQSIRDLVNKVGGLLGGSDEKHSGGSSSTDESSRNEDEVTQDLSPFAADARAADPAYATPSQTAIAADAFSDFDMDDATIQSTPVAAFDARAQQQQQQQQESPAFSEINDEEQFSDRGEMEESFTLSDDLPLPPAHATSSGSAATTLSAGSFETASVSNSASAFATHTARAAEADDALLELGDSTPAREASAEADDFILDMGDEDVFDLSAAPAERAAADTVADAEADMFFAEHAPATESRKFFTEPEVSESPVLLTQEPEEVHEPEDTPHQQEWQEESVTEQPRFMQESAPALESEPMTDSAPPVIENEPAFELTSPSPPPQQQPQPYFESEAAPVVEAESEVAPVAFQESSPAADIEVAGAPEQSQLASASLSPDMMDKLVRRVVAQMSEQVVREIAWEVVPELAERLIKRRLEEEQTRPTP